MLGKEREKNLGSRKKDVNQNREGDAGRERSFTNFPSAKEVRKLISQ